MVKDTEKADWKKFERAVDQLVKSPPMPRKKDDGKASRRQSPKAKREPGRGTHGGSRPDG
jgi:hypothetical protein